MKHKLDIKNFRSLVTRCTGTPSSGGSIIYDDPRTRVDKKSRPSLVECPDCLKKRAPGEK